LLELRSAFGDTVPKSRLLDGHFVCAHCLCGLGLVECIGLCQQAGDFGRNINQVVKNVLLRRSSCPWDSLPFLASEERGLASC
jgi:hypothetical protein